MQADVWAAKRTSVRDRSTTETKSKTKTTASRVLQLFSETGRRDRKVSVLVNCPAGWEYNYFGSCRTGYNKTFVCRLAYGIQYKHFCQLPEGVLKNLLSLTIVRDTDISIFLRCRTGYTITYLCRLSLQRRRPWCREETDSSDGAGVGGRRPTPATEPEGEERPK